MPEKVAAVMERYLVRQILIGMVEAKSVASDWRSLGERTSLAGVPANAFSPSSFLGPGTDVAWNQCVVTMGLIAPVHCHYLGPMEAASLAGGSHERALAR